MTETKKRIKAYKAALPGLRERVIAVALLLAMSTAMMVSASFAWLTLSRAPEVTGVHTEFAANGNLEIALSGPDGATPPEASKIGDSSAALNQSVANSNLTWGNLINLSDPAYGLDNIVLRPAVLNQSKLDSEPFRSVTYGEDGRVINDQNSQFSYCTWKLPDETSEASRFAVTGEYGVRAISTVTERYEFADGQGESAIAKEFRERFAAAQRANNEVDSAYQNQLLKQENLDSLSGILSLYMQDNINPNNEELANPDCTAHIPGVTTLYELFESIMRKELTAIVSLANVQLLVATKSTSFTAFTEETILSKTGAELEAMGVHIEGFDQFKKDLATVTENVQELQVMRDEITQIGRTVRIKEIKTLKLIDDLVEVNSSLVTCDDWTAAIKNIGATAALEHVLPAKNRSVEIQNGILVNFELRAGSYMAESVSITVTAEREVLGIPFRKTETLENVAIYTKNSNKESEFSKDETWTQEQFDNSGMSLGNKILTAGDTYGLAIDFWVRTNASSDVYGVDEEGNPVLLKENISYLTLEGKLKYEQDTGTNADEEAVGLLYSYEMVDPNTQETTVYYVYQDENGDWYEDFAHHGTNNKVSEPSQILSVVYKDAPIGYEGENRVWEEHQQQILQPALSEFNTTQGNGSCYTFYADTPAEEKSILNLLSNMYVVFTDGGKTYLSAARFDTEENHYFSQGGKVTVPLVMMQNKHSYINDQGERVYAVTELTPNEPTRITALLYLNGQSLSNKEALAASEIQGTLNIQFGSNVELTTVGDKHLQEEERVITASVTTADSNNVLDYFTDDLAAKVTINVTGDQPGSVKAFFQREINAYQGTRQEEMVFTQEGSGWVCEDFSFPAPGKYVLRSVQLDGIDYELKECPEVVVEGFNIGLVTVSRDTNPITAKHTTILTTENSVKLDVTMDMFTDDANKMPKKVRLEFLREEDSATIGVDMLSTESGWAGSVNFNSSGEYSLSYVIMDGQLYDLEGMSKTFNMNLGLRAVVEAMPGTPQIVPLENEAVSLAIQAKIVDNEGNSINELDDFPLYYRSDGSGTTLEAVMKWNGQAGYYQGMFHLSQPGTYRFNYLQSGDNRIATASQAVVFRAKSNKPASYVDCINDGNTVFVLPGMDTNAEMLVSLKNTAGGQISAVFVNENDQEYTVDYDQVQETGYNQDTGISTWNIPIPSVNGSQGGTWTLKRLELGNVSDNNGLEYTVDKPLVIALAGTNAGEPVLTVVSKYEVTLGNVAQTNYNGQFMDTHTVNDLSVNFFYQDADGNEQKLPVTISDVMLTYVHGKDSMTYGHYGFNGDVTSIQVSLDDSGDGIKYTGSMQLQHAGTYTLSSVTFKLNGSVITMPGNGGSLPVGAATRFTVSSEKPTVTISAITPNGSHTTINSSNNDQTVTSKIEGNTATVYCETNRGLNGKITTHPSVTLTLNKMGNAESASMVFAANNNGTVYMYTGQSMSGQTNAYTWASGTNTCQRFIGQYRASSTCNGMTRVGAGTLTASTITLMYEGVTYTVSNATITISNPY